jgi:hypothetical protein
MTRKRIQYITDDPDKFTLQEMTEKTEEICESATDFRLVIYGLILYLRNMINFMIVQYH